VPQELEVHGAALASIAWFTNRATPQANAIRCQTIHFSHEEYFTWCKLERRNEPYALRLEPVESERLIMKPEGSVSLSIVRSLWAGRGQLMKKGSLATSFSPPLAMQPTSPS